MKEFDFDSVVCRRGSGSYKWDSSTDSEVIPMWVADMDFKTAPCVIEALQRRVSHGVFGYTRVSDAYYEAVCHWFEQEHGWHINREHIIYTIGVVPAVSAIIKAMTAKGDKVIVQTPAFDCFFSSVRNDECQFVSNPLLQNADGSYSIDFELLSRMAALPLRIISSIPFCRRFPGRWRNGTQGRVRRAAGGNSRRGSGWHSGRAAGWRACCIVS